MTPPACGGDTQATDRLNLRQRKPLQVPCRQGMQQLWNLLILRLNLNSVFTKPSLRYAYSVLCPQSKLCQARGRPAEIFFCGWFIINAPCKKINKNHMYFFGEKGRQKISFARKASFNWLLCANIIKLFVKYDGLPYAYPQPRQKEKWYIQ